MGKKRASHRRPPAGEKARPAAPAAQLYDVLIHRSERGVWEALAETDKARVREKLAGLRRNPRPPDCEKLKGVPKGKPDLYRVRVGALRVVYTIKDALLLVLVLGIRDRKEVYDALATFIGRAN